MISGNMKVGESVTVQCSVDHTCPSYPPSLRLSFSSLSYTPQTRTSTQGTKTTLVSTVVLERDHQSVECTVRHLGGITAKATKTFNAQCMNNLFEYFSFLLPLIFLLLTIFSLFVTQAHFFH